ALQQGLISERHAPALFTTVRTIALFDEEARVRIRVAGHPPPIMVRRDVSEAPHKVGPPLGVLADAQWRGGTRGLHPRRAVMLFRDGLGEGRAGGYGGGDEHDPLWNTGLLGLLREYRSTELTALPARLAELAEGLNGGPLSDDVAILLLLSDGEPAEPR